MIKWDNISWRLGTWAEKIKPFYDGGGFDNIYSFLKAESQNGKKIAPESGDVYKCFLKTPIQELKAVMMGLCPYHTERNGIIVADGLLMSCSKTGELQPSLEKFYGGVEEELKDGLCLECDLKMADLSYLSEQGVLMFNAALTTEIGRAKAHQSKWESFTNFIMKIIGKMDIPVVFLGNEASLFGHHIEKEENKFFLKHPAWASYKKCKWDSEGTFTRINEMLRERGQEEIEWLYTLPF